MPVTLGLVIAGLCAGASVESAPARNLLPNGSFEVAAGDDGLPAAWSCDGPRHGAKARVVYEGARTGRAALLLQQTTPVVRGTGPEAEWAGHVLVGYGHRTLRVNPKRQYLPVLWFRAEGLYPEQRDPGPGQGYACLKVEIFWEDGQGRRINTARQRNSAEIIVHDASVWTEVRGLAGCCGVATGYRQPETPPEEAVFAQLRLSLIATRQGAAPRIWVDDVEFLEIGAGRPANGDFEQGQADRPADWTPPSRGTWAWADDAARSGRRSISVAEAPAGAPAQWTQQVVVSAGERYTWRARVRTAGVNPHGVPAGAYLSVVFHDGLGRPVGRELQSPAVAGTRDWTDLNLDFTVPDPALTMTLGLGLAFSTGRAWFDDAELVLTAGLGAQTQAVSEWQWGPNEAVAIVTAAPATQAEVRFQPNLVPNPSVEQGADPPGAGPAGWTFHGRPDPDWSPSDLQALYEAGYPPFGIGRARGVWDTDAFSGARSLKIVPVHPPLSPLHRWYGTGPIDGYWESDPIPTQPGMKYLAAAWMKVGIARADALSYGFLRLHFFDRQGRRLGSVPNWTAHRPLWSPTDLGEGWGWWVTPVYQAPDQAATMRLVLMGELNAGAGGFGPIQADALALWPIRTAPPLTGLGPRDRLYQALGRSMSQDVPPRLESPGRGVPAQTLWVRVDSDEPGEIFYDPAEPVLLRVELQNLLSVAQGVSFQYIVEDWLGEPRVRGRLSETTIPPYGRVDVPLEVPALGRYGAYVVRLRVSTAWGVLPECLGRFGLVPFPRHPKPPAVANHWGIQGGVEEHLTYTEPAEVTQERAALVRLLGARWAFYDFHDPVGISDLKARRERFEGFRRFWNEAGGVEFVGTIGHSEVAGIRTEEYAAAVRRLVEQFRDAIHVWSVLGVEQANDRSPFRRIPTALYDEQMKAAYEAVKAVDPRAKVLTGAIATDQEARTLQRFYTGPVGKRFDGVILNCYSGASLTVGANLAMMDRHGDTRKPAWIREIGLHAGPLAGPQRLAAEQHGAGELVRTSVQLLSQFWPRFEVISWFCLFRNDQEGCAIVTPELQPRPSYCAFVVMSDKLGQGCFVREIPLDKAFCYLWQDGSRLVAVAWSGAGQRRATFSVDAPAVTVTDLMGNASTLQAQAGAVTVALTESPVYIEGPGRLEPYRDLSATLGYDLEPAAGSVGVVVEIDNRTAQRVQCEGRLELPRGLAAAGDGLKTAVEPRARSRQRIPLATPIDRIDTARRHDVGMSLVTSLGTSVSASGSFSFAVARRAVRPPALDGGVQGWEPAVPLRLDQRWQVRDCAAALEGGRRDWVWKGPDDVSARAYLMWDDRYLYLRVDVTDDVFAPWGQRSFAGFSGDAIEFALQPDGLLRADAPLYEFETFLAPAGPLVGDGRPSGDYSRKPFQAPGRPLTWRHLPGPAVEISDWPVAITRLTRAGDCRYQVAIPWSAVGLRQPAAGRRLGFSLVVDDNDGRAQATFQQDRKWITWFDGIATDKNPSKYGDLVLVE